MALRGRVPSPERCVAGSCRLSATALGFTGEGLETSSALSTFLAESHYAHAKASFVIEGGNDRLPAAFARSLADRIRYGFEVREVTQDGDHVRVSGLARVGGP